MYVIKRETNKSKIRFVNFIIKGLKTNFNMLYKAKPGVLIQLSFFYLSLTFGVEQIWLIRFEYLNYHVEFFLFDIKTS